MKATLLILLILVMSFTVQAEIINVPDDHETVQEAINASENRDTILVQPGEYVENINFDGKAITVAGMYLLTHNEAFIESTIIDGSNEENSVVRFDSGEDENSVLTGFTLTGGLGSDDLEGDRTGGGIHCLRSSPTLSHLNVIGNDAAFGGGLFVQLSSPTITHVRIEGNLATASGGGIYFSRDSTEAVLSHALISGNTAGNFGGGVCCYNAAEPTIDHSTIVGNTANAGGGLAANWNCYVMMTNSIVYGNEFEQIVLSTIDDGDTLIVAYSDIEGGEDEVVVWGESLLIWGDGNINEDPAFIAPDEDNYHLTEDSPCIDTGDPDSPEDIDNTRADMGALNFMQNWAVVRGSVFNAANDEPIADVLITTTHGYSASSDDQGRWQMLIYPDLLMHLLTVHGTDSFVDSTVAIDPLEIGDTLELEIGLLHAVLVPSREEFEVELDQGDSTGFDFTISNGGNGMLEWSVKPGLQDVPEPWELRQSLFVGEEAEETRMKGAVLIDSLYYTAGGGGFSPDDNFIYIFNRDGELLDQYPQFRDSRYGMGDLAWDGELIWGGEDDIIYGFTPDGNVVESFLGPFNPNQAIAWDPDRGILWISAKTSRHIAGYGLDGREVAQLPRFGLTVY